MILWNQFKYHVMLWWAHHSVEWDGMAHGQTWEDAWSFFSDELRRHVAEEDAGRTTKLGLPDTINIELEFKR